MTNVKQYRDYQLLERVEYVKGKVPNRGKYMVLGVQSQEDSTNMFDDKFYVFNGPDFVMVSSGTTNAGKTALMHYDDYGLEGAAVWKTDMFYEDLFYSGYHKKRMRAFRQGKNIWFYRDVNKDGKADESGELHYDIIYANMHGIDYNENSTKVGNLINKWSFGCQVWNDMRAYSKFRKMAWKKRPRVDYGLLKEW